MIEPLRLSFDVACSVQHAWTTWTARIDTWWPADHTVSGERDATVVLEPRVGGRIYERTADGGEHDSGAVTAWEPPVRLIYRWHLRRAPAEATEVEVRFAADGPTCTRNEIEHRGWEALGEAGSDWRDRNHRGWDTLLPHYRTATEQETA